MFVSQKSEKSRRCSTCARGFVVVPWKLKVGEDSLEIMDSFCYLGDVISCGGGVESAVRNRISCAWSKLLVNQASLEERVKVYCACVRPALLYAGET